MAGKEQRFPNLNAAHPLNKYEPANNDKTCKDCVFCVRRKRSNRNVYKCVLCETNSITTDIRLKYAACEKYRKQCFPLVLRFVQEHQLRSRVSVAPMVLGNGDIGITIINEQDEPRNFTNESDALGFLRGLYS